MSSKSKSKDNKNSWSKCRFCPCVLPTQDANYHLNYYHGSNGSQQATPKSSKQNAESEHGYIRHNILHTYIKDLKSPNTIKEKKEDYVQYFKLVVSKMDNLILLHPAVMEAMEIYSLSWVAIWRNDGSSGFLILKAFKCKYIGSKTGVVLSYKNRQLLECEIDDLVHVQKIQTPNSLPAKRIDVIAIDERYFYDSAEFLRYFNTKSDGNIILKGSIFSLNYLGQTCAMKVTNMACDDVFKEAEQSKVASTKQNEADICQSMDKLELNPSNKNGGSTPKKNVEPPHICQCEKTRPPFDGTCAYVHSNTKLNVTNMRQKKEPQNNWSLSVTFDDIGGLSDQISRIKRILEKPAVDQGINRPKGIVLFGSPGCGKSLIANAIRNTTDQTFISVKVSKLFCKYYGESESKLRGIFENAKQRAPSIVFIDNFEALCSKKGQSWDQSERVMSTLLKLMDDLSNNPDERVVVLVATDDIDSLDLAARRVGRFDYEVEINIPIPTERADILATILRRCDHNLTTENIKEISMKLHGFIGSDLKAVCHRAEMIRYERQNQSENEVKFLTYEDVTAAAKMVRPSTLRDILIEVPTVHWEDVGGQEDLKETLKAAVEWPLHRSKLFETFALPSTKGILMYGPPGCSKTMIAKALATESHYNFLAIKGPELFNKWVGESERAVRELFRKARSVAPSIIFFDEIDALAAKRGSSSGGSNVSERVVSQLLTEMDGLQKLDNVIIIAATNRPEMIDDALKRRGRFDHHVYVPLPDAKTREEIFRIQFRRTPVAEDVDVVSLAARTEGYSGAEIIAVCIEAGCEAIRKDLNPEVLKEVDFEHALTVVKPRTSKEMIRGYEANDRKV